MPNFIQMMHSLPPQQAPMVQQAPMQPAPLAQPAQQQYGYPPNVANMFLRMGLGILGANTRFATTGEAIGRGALAGLDSYQRMLESEGAGAFQQAQMAQMQAEAQAARERARLQIMQFQADAAQRQQEAAARNRFLATANLTPTQRALYEAGHEEEVAKQLTTPEKTTNITRMYEEAGGQQGTGMTLIEFMRDMAKRKAATTKIEMPGEQFTEELGTQLAKDLVTERMPAARQAAAGLQTVNEGKRLLDQGVFTGKFGPAQQAFGQALKDVGIDYGGDAVANTEAYMAAMGREVGSLIQMFGAGTGLSDADRKYAERMAGGDIAVSEAGLRKILDINERARRNLLKQYNKDAESVMKSSYGVGLPFDITVEIPEPYTPGGTGEGGGGSFEGWTIKRVDQ